MRLPKRDLIASALVGVAVVLYVLWALESTVSALAGTRATGIVILALGFAASASAVVPSFDELVHGNKWYLAGTSLLGLVAFAAGLQVLVAASDAALGLMVVTTVVLWFVSTVHHTMLAHATAPARARPGVA